MNLELGFEAFVYFFVTIDIQQNSIFVILSVVSIVRQDKIYEKETNQSRKKPFVI